MKDSPSDKAQPVGEEDQAIASDQPKQVGNWQPIGSLIAPFVARRNK